MVVTRNKKATVKALSKTAPDPNVIVDIPIFPVEKFFVIEEINSVISFLLAMEKFLKALEMSLFKMNAQNFHANDQLRFVKRAMFDFEKCTLGYSDFVNGAQNLNDERSKKDKNDTATMFAEKLFGKQA